MASLLLFASDKSLARSLRDPVLLRRRLLLAEAIAPPLALRPPDAKPSGDLILRPLE